MPCVAVSCVPPISFLSHLFELINELRMVCCSQSLQLKRNKQNHTAHTDTQHTQTHRHTAHTDTQHTPHTHTHTHPCEDSTLHSPSPCLSLTISLLLTMNMLRSESGSSSMVNNLFLVCQNSRKRARNKIGGKRVQTRLSSFASVRIWKVGVLDTFECRYCRTELSPFACAFPSSRFESETKQKARLGTWARNTHTHTRAHARTRKNKRKENRNDNKKGLCMRGAWKKSKSSSFLWCWGNVCSQARAQRISPKAATMSQRQTGAQTQRQTQTQRHTHAHTHTHTHTRPQSVCLFPPSLSTHTHTHTPTPTHRGSPG